jgi:hypothetical protein
MYLYILYNLILTKLFIHSSIEKFHFFAKCFNTSSQTYVLNIERKLRLKELIEILLINFDF